MENKKTKLTISGIAKKSIQNIEIAKTQGKNSVVIEKQPSKFPNRGGSFRPTGVKSKPSSSFDRGAPSIKPSFPQKASPIANDFEKRKLAEQRATKRLKGEDDGGSKKAKLGTKKRELKLTISRAISDDDDIESRARSLASIKRARLKQNKVLTKEETKENLKPIKRDVNIPEAITVRELANS
jgi:translation initiation factor IF-2